NEAFIQQVAEHQVSTAKNFKASNYIGKFWIPNDSTALRATLTTKDPSKPRVSKKITHLPVPTISNIPPSSSVTSVKQTLLPSTTNPSTNSLNRTPLEKQASLANVPARTTPAELELAG